MTDMATRDEHDEHQWVTKTHLTICLIVAIVLGFALGAMCTWMVHTRGVVATLLMILPAAVGSTIGVAASESNFGAKWLSRRHSDGASTEATDQRLSDWTDSSTPAGDAEESVIAEKPANSSPQSAGEDVAEIHSLLRRM